MSTIRTLYARFVHAVSNFLRAVRASWTLWERHVDAIGML